MSLQLMLIWPKSCPEIQLEYFSRYVKIFNFTSLAITYLLLLNKFVPLQAKKNFFFRGRTDLPVMYGRTYLPVWTDVPVRMYVPTCMDGCTYLHRRMYLHVRADVPTCTDGRTCTDICTYLHGWMYLPAQTDVPTCTSGRTYLYGWTYLQRRTCRDVSVWRDLYGRL